MLLKLLGAVGRFGDMIGERQVLRMGVSSTEVSGPVSLVESATDMFLGPFSFPSCGSEDDGASMRGFSAELNLGEVTDLGVNAS